MNQNLLLLFVWHDVFSDHTSGIAFAIAENAEEARQILYRQLGNTNYIHNQLSVEPSVYQLTEKVGFAAFGGS